MNARQQFQRHLAPTSPAPVALHIIRAEGTMLYDADGREYIDLIGGISVCNTGHGHPQIVAAIKAQADAFLHTMVYGELVLTPQIAYAARLSALLPDGLDCVYFTNSGAEAVEGAIKLARRATGRTGIIAAHKSYHGSTTGALSLLGDEYFRNAFRPLMPGVQHYAYNSKELAAAISEETACVVLETIQAEAGLIVPHPAWLESIRLRCQQTGTLLVLDEIQCGFGRTGTLWAFEQYGVVPDILLLGKALGGGMPLGAFIAGNALMQHLASAPVLGHITTFGGHPVCCAAGLAGLDALLDEKMIGGVAAKEKLFHQHLQHPRIIEVRSSGLLMAIQLGSGEEVLQVLACCLKEGLFSDWFLFAANCIRIAPPLNIPDELIIKACSAVKRCLDSLQ